MRVLTSTLLLVAAAIPAPAQSQALLDVPASLASVEENRSRSCVATLEQVRVLDTELAPYAAATARIQQIAQAVTIEDAMVLGSMNSEEGLEGAVAAWFATDQLLAQRFVESQLEGIQEERAAGKSTIRATIVAAAEALQAEVDSILTENQETVLAAGPCDGAIFVRPAVVEACGELTSPICDAARQPDAPPTGFFFVDDPLQLWEMRELRPWTEPTRLQVGPTGQLDGARTIGYTRIGNIVVTAALSPILRANDDVSPAERFQFDQTNQALGLLFDHPSIAFAPGFGMRAALPEALAGEDEYVVHFGDPASPDVIWRGPAGTGSTLEATIPMEAGHILRLRNGDALSLTAVRGEDPQYTIPLDTTGQTAATEALVTYMSSQLSTDLNELIRPTG